MHINMQLGFHSSNLQNQLLQSLLTSPHSQSLNLFKLLIHIPLCRLLRLHIRSRVLTINHCNYKPIMNTVVAILLAASKSFNSLSFLDGNLLFVLLLRIVHLLLFVCDLSWFTSLGNWGVYIVLRGGLFVGHFFRPTKVN